jgi:hypothetical protein
MSLYKSVLETLHKDFCRLETSMIADILHGATSQSMDPKPIGKAASTQWARVFLSAISKWCSDNAHAVKAPESFLPEFNEDIKAIMHPTSNEIDDSNLDTAE